jgi:uncharacterized protein YkwD
MLVRAVTMIMLLALPVALAAQAPQDPAGAVNAVRARGCGGRPAVKPALRPDARLDRAAARIAAGDGLRDALQSAGYRATQVAVLEASGNPASFARSLAEGGCKDITEAAYRDLGVAQRDGVTWLVLAAPLEAPAAGEAATTNARVLALVNEARTEKRRCGFRRFDAVPPLAPSAALQRAASAHAEDMARRGVMDHAGGDGSTPADRATRAGYAWRTVGENVATGQSTPEQVVAEWLDSPRHCSNIMDAGFTEMGVAVASSATGVYWAQVFGAPQP